jgi:hypothetical protein
MCGRSLVYLPKAGGVEPRRELLRDVLHNRPEFYDSLSLMLVAEVLTSSHN